MQITNNISAFNVWKNYTSNVKGLRSSMSRLSSGTRINHSDDDPSELAMSERLRTQSRNTSAAAGNVESKLNYLQTADSWLQEIHDMLGHMSELSATAHDGTKSQGDRDVLQKEFGRMQEKIKRITSGATAAGRFNGQYLFRGGDGVDSDGVAPKSAKVDLQVSNTQVIGSFSSYSYGSINMTLIGSTVTSVTWSSLISGDSLSIASQVDAASAVGKMAVGIDYLSEKRAVLGAEMKRVEQALEELQNYNENISATESRIRDVDAAKQTAEASKYQILQQVGTAKLAQANQLPTGVMQLLGQ